MGCKLASDQKNTQFSEKKTFSIDALAHFYDCCQMFHEQDVEIVCSQMMHVGPKYENDALCITKYENGAPCITKYENGALCIIKYENGAACITKYENASRTDLTAELYFAASPIFGHQGAQQIYHCNHC